MTSLRTTQRRSLPFRFFTIPFLLLFGIAWVLGGLIAYAEPPIGSAPSDEKFLPVPLVVTIFTRGMPALSAQAPSRLGSGIGDIL